MNDNISRQAAIDAVCRSCLRTDLEVLDGCLGEDCSAKAELKALPSAEPLFCPLADRTCPFQGEKIAWCLTCPHISKEDRELVKKAVECSRPETGRWIEDAVTFYKAINERGGEVDENTPYFAGDIACSECLAIFSTIDNETERFDFCPLHSADMRGGK